MTTKERIRHKSWNYVRVPEQNVLDLYCGVVAHDLARHIRSQNLVGRGGHGEYFLRGSIRRRRYDLSFTLGSQFPRLRESTALYLKFSV